MQSFYFFGNGQADGSAADKNILGGKGANLAEMSRIGLPVPAGFTIPTSACMEYYRNNEHMPQAVETGLAEAVSQIEQMTGKQFGGAQNPLLLSVRSGAAVSMPGMMDTILNLGLNDKTVEALAHKSGSARFAYDSYRRFIQMYANVVLGLNMSAFEHELEVIKEANNLASDTDLTAEQLMLVVERYKAKLLELGGVFPQDPIAQLRAAIDAVFGSWMNDRAVTYRRIQHLSDAMGTAVTVQAMVFGNMGETSGTGVAFTRNPSTGENVFFGEFLLNAQGEDVVAGIRTPQPLTQTEDSLERLMPSVFAQLNQLQQQLEGHYGDMQDIEFTIEEGELYLLQTRTGKRTAAAMVRIGVDMVQEGIISTKECIGRMDAEKLDELMHPTIPASVAYVPIGRGLPASPGVACGQVVFDADTAEEMATIGHPVILVRVETSPEDINGMHSAEGVLTARGGMTSHAAVVARGMGKCCVSGCPDLLVDYAEQEMTLQQPDGARKVIRKGDWLTLSGSTGEVIEGRVETAPPSIDDAFLQVLTWADEIRTLKVRTNADTAESAKRAREFGAEGIGLCRTEHMFFDEMRIRHMRSMILAETKDERVQALEKLLPYQQSDFEGIFTAMDGLPVTVRLLDPPLHEFLPESEAEIKLIAEELGVSVGKIKDRIHALDEQNPMLGMRGCRLGNTMPELTEMQVRALMQGAIICAKKGISVLPEIMVPLVGHVKELQAQKELITQVANSVMEEQGHSISYIIGTMIELPRACMIADEIAEYADFFSFGTNDLTQTTLGFSRDDSGKFLDEYIKTGILEYDPFIRLDIKGVGGLMKMAIEKGKQTNSRIKTGICGEHGGDPASIIFCQKAGLDYVSPSPYRVPVARVAAAKAELDNPST